MIERVTATPLAPTGAAGFAIAPSLAGGDRQTLVSPDTATCADCLRELRRIHEVFGEAPLG